MEARGLQSEQRAPPQPPTAIINKKPNTKGTLPSKIPPKEKNAGCVRTDAYRLFLYLDNLVKKERIMNTRKTFGYGLIAVIVTLAFAALSLTGCENPAGSGFKNLAGNISITPVGTATTGTELTAAYSGTETVSYQWYKNGTAIPGATNIKYTPSEAGSYTVTVSAPGYNSKTSAAVTVTGESLHILSGDITIAFDDLTKTEIITGTELTAAYSGTETVTYQWYKDGEAIDGATNSAYTPTEAGSYTVTVRVTGYQSKMSDPIIVTALELTGDVTISPNTGVNTGTELTAAYSGTETVTFQWKRGGRAISGATNSAYTPNESGSYTVTVSAAGYQSKTSDPVIVTALEFTGTVTINPNTEVFTVTELTATYSGTETVTFQWYKDGEAIDGATNSAYTPEEAGSYTVTVSAAGYNPKTSDPVIVTAREFTGDVTIGPDTEITTGMLLTASYDGDEDVNYQWKKDGTVIPGATNSTYTPEEAGNYTVTVSAAGYNSKTSAPIVVKGIVIDPDLPIPTADDYIISGNENAVTYDGNAKAVTVTADTDKSGGAVTVYYEGTNGTTYHKSENAPTNAGTYTVTFNVAAATGWNPAINLAAGALTINKAAGAIVSAPTAASTEATSVTLTAIPTTSTDQAVEYAKNTTNTAPSDGWQDDVTFTGLTANTTYYFFARAKADDNYETGAASSSLSVTTTLPNLAGTVSISPSSGVTTGTELTANYSGGSETITTYQWEKDGTNVGTNAATFTPTEVGSYTVTVSATGYNPKTSNAVDVGNASNANFTSVTITSSSGFQTGTQLTASYTSAATPGTVTYEWRRDNAPITGANSSTYTPLVAGSYTVTVSATGFNPHTSAAVTVSNRTPVAGDYTITNLTQTYNGSQRTASIVAQSGKSAGTVTIYYTPQGGTASTNAPTNAGTYTVTFNVAADNTNGWNAANNLAGGTLTINKATGSAVSGAPTLSGTPLYNSITVSTVSLSTATGQVVEYARNSSSTVPSTGWQEDRDFGSLTANTDYYFFARSKETNNYNAGAASTGNLIKTASQISITTQPTSPTTVTAGSITGSLSVTATATGAALSYQWYSNTSNSSTGGSVVSGATSATFTIPTTLTAGTYCDFCEVSATNNAAAVRSTVATVTVNAAAVPVITISAHPASTTTVTAGSISGSLSVTASVTQSATLSYQWYSNTTASNTGGSTVATGGTSASFTIPTTLTAGTYYYFCEVRATNNAVSVRSSVATVTVNAAPNYDFIITRDGVYFTARNQAGAVVGTANQSSYNVMIAIRQVLASDPFNPTIQLGDGTTALDMSTGTLPFEDPYEGEWGSVTLTGKITSSNTNTDGGTITISNNMSSSITIEGEVINTAANGNAVYNASNSSVTIRGGTIGKSSSTATTGYAIISTGTTTGSRITLQLSPTITGRIRPSVTSAGVGVLSTTNTGANTFAPGSKTYTLDYPSYTTNGAVAVTNGASFASSFVLSGAPSGVSLVESGANLVFNVPTNTPVTFSSLTANGDASTASTTLTLTFSQAITGLTASDISLSLSGNGTTVTKGTLTNTSGGTYTLRISAFHTGTSTSGTLTAQVTKNGYTITNSSRTATVYCPFDYIIQNDSGNAAKNRLISSRNGREVEGTGMAGYLTTIRTQAGTNACSIEFRGGSSALIPDDTILDLDNLNDGQNIRNVPAEFTGTWGTVTLKGKITSAITTTSSGTVVIGGAINVINQAEITNTTAGNAIYFNSTGSLTVNSGTVRNTSTGHAVYNAAAGTVTLSSGTVSAGSGAGSAVYNGSTGLITVSGATVSSASTSGTIYLAGSGSGTAERLRISGGTVSNTASNRQPVYNASTGKITVTGGTITATPNTGYAIQNTDAAATIDLGGNPTITGRIRPSAPGTLSVLTSGTTFAPSPTTKKFDIEFSALTSGQVAVVNGYVPTNFLTYFNCYVGGSAVTLIRGTTTANTNHLVRQ
jgi:hypothetical protein